MDGLAIMQVSVAVLALMHLMRWAGVSHRWAPLVVPLASAVGVGLWGYAHPPVSQVETFSYLAGWISVATTAASAWGFTWANACVRSRRKS
jgi:hypothetical protein